MKISILETDEELSIMWSDAKVGEVYLGEESGDVYLCTNQGTAVRLSDGQIYDVHQQAQENYWHRPDAELRIKE